MAAGEPPTLERLVAEQKLRQAAMRLGATFVEAAGLVEYDPEEESASWRHHRGTGAESIHVGPAICAMSVDNIEMVLRHELLHRSMFHGFGERFTNHSLANVTLDVCINRLLFEAWPERMRELSKEVYEEESAGTIIDLANCAAEASKLPAEQRALWHQIWDRGVDGDMSRLNPSALYYQLLRLQGGGGGGDGEDGEHGGWGTPHSAPDVPRYPPGMPRTPPPLVAKAIDKVLEDVRGRLPRSSDAGSALGEYCVSLVDIGTSKVEEFLRRIRLRRVVRQTASKIREPFQRRSRVQPFPWYPSRMGLAYLAAGVSDVFRLYWNLEVHNTGVKRALAFYVDVSGSMAGNYKYVAAFIDELRDVPLRVRAFDDSVREVDVEEMAAGRIRGGGGTDFDPPIVDLVQSNDIEAGVLFTDGYAPVSTGTVNLLRQSGKRLFVVYLVADDGEQVESPLNSCATDTLTIVTEDYP